MTIVEDAWFRASSRRERGVEILDADACPALGACGKPFANNEPMLERPSAACAFASPLKRNRAEAASRVIG